jgi:hypothetical protein
MRKLLLAAAAVLVAAPALAGTMESSYGNTVTVTNAEGKTMTLLFSEDGTFTGTGYDGAAIGGKWVVKEGKYCSTANAVEGQPAPTEACTDYVDGKNVGDSWKQKGTDGADITVAITAGRT